ncbi:hypothetical protein [Clostridium tagluense]|uniref:hypothetical protein n=1 Tax=Clostridium tagluense TaxID=360422 RepID=UPI001C0ABA90|nr:hypothetical protein [Clostridium tagluense]MBU3129115.1 hypothetical protein [Clostridium tagluense]
MVIVTKSSAIYKFLIELKITIYLTAPQIHHLILFINSMVTKGYCGKITDISDFMPVRHRTNEHKIRKINFIGSDCNKNRLYWLSTHIALLSGLFQAQKEKSETIEEFPLLLNGNNGYISRNNKASCLRLLQRNSQHQIGYMKQLDLS